MNAGLQVRSVERFYMRVAVGLDVPTAAAQAISDPAVRPRSTASPPLGRHLTLHSPVLPRPAPEQSGGRLISSLLDIIKPLVNRSAFEARQ